jgi:NitT/TauT family transport system substrate-binding protein
MAQGLRDQLGADRWECFMSGLFTRRKIVHAAALTGGVIMARPARAALPKVRFLTSWFAQAEQGGFYQAKAMGLYEKAGIDVDLAMGGPQVNNFQLLAAGAADIIMGYDIQVLKAVEQGVPVVNIGASFQFDLQGIMAHEDIQSLADLKGHKILIASSARNSFWPWLKQKYGWSEEQAAPYTFNLQPFFASPDVAQQAFLTAEPFQAEKQGIKTKFFLLADEGYPPYSSAIVSTRSFIEKQPDVVSLFVRASMEGWRSYIQDPRIGNDLIKQMNPKQTDDQLDYSLRRLREVKAITGGDAATHGIGYTSEARWRKTRDFLVAADLLKSDVDWKRAFTTQFVDDLRVMPSN